MSNWSSDPDNPWGDGIWYKGNDSVKVTGNINTHCRKCGDILNKDERESGVCKGGCYNHDGSEYEE